VLQGIKREEKMHPQGADLPGGTTAGRPWTCQVRGQHVLEPLRLGGLRLGRPAESAEELTQLGWVGDLGQRQSMWHPGIEDHTHPRADDWLRVSTRMQGLMVRSPAVPRPFPEGHLHSPQHLCVPRPFPGSFPAVGARPWEANGVACVGSYQRDIIG
jgi:hypothetical protein